MHPVGRAEQDLDFERQRDHDMTDDENHEIGWSVIGPMMAHLRAAGVALIRHLQKGAKQVPAPTAGAATKKALAHSLQHVALRALSGHSGLHGAKVGT